MFLNFRIFRVILIGIFVSACISVAFVLGDEVELVWIFQDPTDLIEKNTVGLSDYNCDTAQVDCKVNFDFTPFVPVSDEIITYSCWIDFWFWMTWEESKCNPDTITFPKGNSTVRVQVIQDDTQSVVRSGQLTIHNPIIDVPTTTIEDPYIPDKIQYSIWLTWQNSTQLLNKEDVSLSEYFCDTREKQCNINFLVTPLKNEILDNELTCAITADFEIWIWADPCNPTQSTVPIWEHIITIKILKKSDSSEVSTRIITLKNIINDIWIDPTRVTMELVWQSPSYLLPPDVVLVDTLTCDPEKDSCKINPIISPLLDGKKSPELICNISADFELIPTIDPCNPNTSTVPSWDHTLTINVLQKSTQQVLISREIHLKNNSESTTIDATRITSKISWQSPSYLVEKDNVTLTEYNCDTSQPDCKVNLLVTPFLDGIESTKLSCQITSDFELVPTTDPCNPNTSIIPVGEHPLIIEIIHKSDGSVLTTRTILLKHNISITWVTSWWNWGGWWVAVVSNLNLSSSEIKVQSGLDELGKCRNSMCKVNFIIEVPPWVVCAWNFGSGTFETKDTDKKCNPGFVQFQSDTDVSVTLTDPWNSLNTLTRVLHISYPMIEEKIIDSSQPHITVQWKLWKNKRLIDGWIICALGKSESCSLNFTTEEKIEGAKYFWNFWNGQTSDRQNPGAEKFVLWKYDVLLTVTLASGMTKEIYYWVEVVKDFIEPVVCPECEKMIGKVQIYRALANPLHADTVEWIEIKNISTEIQNLDQCSLSDNHKKYPLSWNIQPGKVLRLLQMQTNLTLWNTYDALGINCWDFLIDSFFWDYTFPEWYILRRVIMDQKPIEITEIVDVDRNGVTVEIKNTKVKIWFLWVDTLTDLYVNSNNDNQNISEIIKSFINWKTIWMTFDNEHSDSRGSILSYLWTCESVFDPEICSLVNSHILSQWVGRMKYDKLLRYQNILSKAEKEAKSKKIGVWSNSSSSRQMIQSSKIEKETLDTELEKEYLSLHSELLLFSQNQCWALIDCDWQTIWTGITSQLSSLNAKNLKDGSVKLSGSSWWNSLATVVIFSWKREIFRKNVMTNSVWKFSLEWFPKSTGVYTSQFLVQPEGLNSEVKEKRKEFNIEKELSIKIVSPHFESELQGEIAVQWGMSKNRWLWNDGTFQCRSRWKCSINLTASHNRKNNILYEWILPSGEIFTGKNPKSFSVWYGDFIVKMKMIDTITREEYIKIIPIHHSPIPKKAKKSKTTVSKYLFDIKDPKDSGWGVILEPNSFNISQILLAFFVLWVLSLLFFWRNKLTDKI